MVFKYKQIKPKFQKAVLACGIVGFVFQTTGVVALATSKEIDSSELQKRIAENEKAIEANKRNAKSDGSVEKGKVDDYASSGNSQKVSAVSYTHLKTKMGRAMRAVSVDEDAARLMGIDVDKTISFTFLLGSALACLLYTSRCV